MNLKIGRLPRHYFFYCCVLATISLTQGLLANKNISSYLDINKYTLQYVINYDTDFFNATVDIDFTVKKADKLGTTLTVDREGIVIVDASLKDPSSGVDILTFKSTDYNTTFQLAKQLKARSSYTLAISFYGEISLGNKGIFKYNANNKKYISTNLYPFYARQAFPCFNDVSIKSVFSLTIIAIGNSYDPDSRAISNIRIAHKNEDNTVFQFEDTPPISVNNLFFTIGYYLVSPVADNLYLPQENEITFNHEIKYVFNNKEYQVFMDATKLPSLTIVCVPGLPKDSLSAHGVVALRADNLFMDLTKTTTEQRKTSLLNIFGAVYKQFYGGMLIPKSWSDSWLVESIPIYLKFNGLSEVDEWGDPNDYIYHDIQQAALISNGHAESGPVVDDTVKTEDDVLNFISGPAMLKGAGILTMLENVLTKPTLLDVLVQYLSDSILKNNGVISTDDFVTFLSKHKEVTPVLHGIDITGVLNTWLKQASYPYLEIKRVGNGITLFEKTFMPEKSNSKESMKTWKFPIFYSTEGEPIFDDTNYFWLLSEDEKPVSLNFTASPSQWIIINVNGTGLYRVHYEDYDWEILAFALNGDHEQFPTSTRAKLINDAFAMLLSGYSNFSNIFTFLTYLQKEESLTPWLAAIDSLKYMGSLLQATDLKEDFDTYVITILQPIFKKLGIDQLSPNNEERTLRQKIVSTICGHGEQNCTSQTEADFKKMSDGSYSPNNDIRPVILCNGLKTISNLQDWKKWFTATFDDENLLGVEVRRAYYEALACAQDSNIIASYLDLIFKETSSIEKDHVPIAFKSIFTNPQHVSQALEYFVVEEQLMRKDITMNDKVQMMKAITPYLTTDDEMNNLKKYLEVVIPPKIMQDAVNKAMNNLNDTQVFLKNNHDEIKKALQEFTPPTPTPTSPTGTTPTSTTSHGTDTTGTGTGTTGTGTTGKVTTTSPTKKPGSATSIYAFNIITLLLIYMGLHFIR